MPYIPQDQRADFRIGLVGGATPGQLNFLISHIIKQYWECNPRYQTIAQITGVLENVKQEFYRRVAVPYEDTKVAENGDVW